MGIPAAVKTSDCLQGTAMLHRQKLQQLRLHLSTAGVGAGGLHLSKCVGTGWGVHALAQSCPILCELNPVPAPLGTWRLLLWTELSAVIARRADLTSRAVWRQRWSKVRRTVPDGSVRRRKSTPLIRASPLSAVSKAVAEALAQQRASE